MISNLFDLDDFYMIIAPYFYRGIYCAIRINTWSKLLISSIEQSFSENDKIFLTKNSYGIELSHDDVEINSTLPHQYKLFQGVY